MGLFERRAEVVARGIACKDRTVKWKGESEPLAVTGDGIKEPQNRRIEIILE